MALDYSILRSKPWLDLPKEVVADIILPKGFIGEEERRSYYYIARHFSEGKGAIVDAGACLGSSAYCFAAGLKDNPARGDTVIHSYDKFEVGEDYVGELIQQCFRPTVGGDSFLDIFEYQIGRYKEFVRGHVGNFLEEKWERGRIDILFVDLAKTQDLHDHIVQEFYTALVPGESLLMHQDFYHAWNPWMHIGMEFFVDRFELLDEYIPTNSRLFLTTKPILPAEVVEMKSLSRERRLELMDSFIERETGDQRAMARVSKLCQLWIDNDVNGYADERARLEAESGWPENTAWAFQGRQLDSHIANGVRY